MHKHVKRGGGSNDSRRPVIVQGRFWWQYDDGHRERIYMSERAKNHLWQTKAVNAMHEKTK